MPLDIKLFRSHEGGNPDLIRESQRRRFASVEIVDEIIEKDTRWRFLTGEIDNLKKSRNQIQKEVANKIKSKEPCDEMVAQIKSIGEQIVATENEQEEIKVQVSKLINKVGNIVDDHVPVSKDEDADNRVERSWGTPRDPAGLLNHHDLLWRIGGYEPDRGVAVAGHRGYFLRGPGVLLNQAFINYGIAFLGARGYCPLQPPYMMKKDVMSGVAQLEQFDEELYKVGGDSEDKYLIATSEQPLCGFHMGEWMDEKTLPIRYAGISTCFRKEAGAHGKDTWGIFRVHQFEKVEQFVVCEGDLEKSSRIQDDMIATAEEFYQSLGFPYHVINIVSGALNNAAIKKLDLECWFPGYNAYRELVSCSNCTDYQSRPMEIRSGVKKMGDKEKKYVHLLNATLCATGRAICCLLETYQEPNGVRIPEVLIPFMGGLTFLPFIREPKAHPSVAPTSSTPAGEGKKKKGSEKSSTPAPTTAPTPLPTTAAPTTTPPVGDDSLTSEINSLGEEVRRLKTDKADKEVIKASVDRLLSLKAQYQETHGHAFGTSSTSSTSTNAPVPTSTSTSGGGASGGGGEKEKKEKKDKSNKEKSTSTPTPTPAPAPTPTPPTFAPIPDSVRSPPVYTTSAPTPRTPPPTVVQLQTSSISLPALNSLLSSHPYVGHWNPTLEDAIAFDAISVLASSEVESLPYLHRWVRHMNSFSAEERAGWR